MIADKTFAHIIGAVHHYRAIAGVVVTSFFESVEFQRFPVLSEVNLSGSVKPETTFIRFRYIGKALRELFSGISTVSDECIEQHFLAIEIDYPQSFLVGRKTEIDDRQDRKSTRLNSSHVKSS